MVAKINLDTQELRSTRTVTLVVRWIHRIKVVMKLGILVRFLPIQVTENAQCLAKLGTNHVQQGVTAHLKLLFLIAFGAEKILLRCKLLVHGGIFAFNALTEKTQSQAHSNSSASPNVQNFQFYLG